MGHFGFERVNFNFLKLLMEIWVPEVMVSLSGLKGLGLVGFRFQGLGLCRVLYRAIKGYVGIV